MRTFVSGLTGSGSVLVVLVLVCKKTHTERAERHGDGIVTWEKHGDRQAPSSGVLASSRLAKRKAGWWLAALCCCCCSAYCECTMLMFCDVYNSNGEQQQQHCSPLMLMLKTASRTNLRTKHKRNTQQQARQRDRRGAHERESRSPLLHTNTPKRIKQCCWTSPEMLRRRKDAIYLRGVDFSYLFYLPGASNLF